MNIRQIKPLRIKLLWILGSSLFCAVAVHFIASSFSVNTYLRRSLATNLASSSNTAAQYMRASIKGFEDVLKRSTRDVLRVPEASRELRMQEIFKDMRTGVVSFAILERVKNKKQAEPTNFSISKTTDFPELSGLGQDSLKRRILKSITKQFANNSPKKNSLMMAPIPTSSKFPAELINIAMTFAIQDLTIQSRDLGNNTTENRNNRLAIGVITVLKSELIGALGSAGTQGELKQWNSFLVTNKGTLIGSAQKMVTTGKRRNRNISIRLNRGFIRATENISSSAGEALPSQLAQIESSYQWRGERFMGAHARVPGYEWLIVLNQVNMDALTNFLWANVIESALWGLFIAIAGVGIAFLPSLHLSSNFHLLEKLVLKIGSGDFSQMFPPNSKDEIGHIGNLLVNVGDHLGSDVGTARSQARFAKEFGISKSLQAIILPKKRMQTQHLTVSGFYQAAETCGGDFWGHISLNDNVEILYIGDAMGRGSRAVITAGICYSAIQTISLELINDQKKLDATTNSASLLMESLNQVIFNSTKGKMSISFLLCILDYNKGVITYSGAGQNFPIVLPARDTSKGRDLVKQECKDNKKVGERGRDQKYAIAGHNIIRLRSKGTPLGINNESRYESHQLDFKPGDRIILYSNGLVNASSPGGKPWGEKSLIRTLAENSALNHADLKDRVVESAFKYYGSHPAADDITLVIAEISDLWIRREMSKSIVGNISQIAPQDPPQVPPYSRSRLSNKHKPDRGILQSTGKEKISAISNNNKNEISAEVQHENIPSHNSTLIPAAPSTAKAAKESDISSKATASILNGLSKLSESQIPPTAPPAGREFTAPISSIEMELGDIFKDDTQTNKPEKTTQVDLEMISSTSQPDNISGPFCDIFSSDSSQTIDRNNEGRIDGLGSIRKDLLLNKLSVKDQPPAGFLANSAVNQPTQHPKGNNSDVKLNLEMIETLEVSDSTGKGFSKLPHAADRPSTAIEVAKVPVNGKRLLENELDDNIEKNDSRELPVTKRRGRKKAQKAQTA